MCSQPKLSRPLYAHKAIHMLPWFPQRLNEHVLCVADMNPCGSTDKLV